MKKIYYLQTCDSCRKILNMYDFSGFEKQEIKAQPITAQQLDEIKNMTKSYEVLFSRRAKKYKELGLKNEKLSEQEIRYYILNDYTFLKRPVIINGNQIFVGNDKNNLEKLKEHFKQLSI